MLPLIQCAPELETMGRLGATWICRRHSSSIINRPGGCVFDDFIVYRNEQNPERGRHSIFRLSLIEMTIAKHLLRRRLLQDMVRESDVGLKRNSIKCLTVVLHGTPGSDLPAKRRCAMRWRWRCNRRWQTLYVAALPCSSHSRCNSQ